ncbi:MAG TPA: hypothetical protein VKD90_20590 [Gemmataceae bacterium]|nr:hypothetical protein [Gemmataceae bacterium]
MLRLTLRTLLAYLDDTLGSAEAKDIGKKVAESEFAQETIERIKTVTRRRRLSAPPVEADDHSLDPNTIAEYLDNVLPPDQVTELEQAALDQDVRLAEVAACHQILTLVLGEPAKVPPTARVRMYRLVKGPEALPYRPPAAAAAPVVGLAAPAEVDEFQDHEEDLLHTFLGPRSALWLVALLIAVGLLAAAVWLAVPRTPEAPHQGYIVVQAPPPAGMSGGFVPRTETTRAPVPAAKKAESIDNGNVDRTSVPAIPKAINVEPEPGPPPRLFGEPAPAPVNIVPDAERRPVATFDTPKEPLLLRKRDTARWERADANEPRVSSTDMLLALPGFHPEVRLDSGVRVQLWGMVPDFMNLPLAETRVTVHVPARGLDADLTLHGGRIFLTAPMVGRPVWVRIRFRGETWDVRLADGDTEVAFDRIGEPAKGLDRDVPEDPRALVYLGVLSGSGRVRTSDYQVSDDLTAGAKWKWDSKGGRPGPAPKDDKDDAGVPNRWTKAVPATAIGKEAAAATAELARVVGVSQGPFEIDFDATVKEARTASRRVIATWMLAAVDSLGYLIDALESDSAPVRDAAAKALQHWVAQDPDREAVLAEVLGMKAAYSDAQRAALTALLGSPDRPSDAADRLFELLLHDKMSVRELARLQLARLDPAGAKESGYDAASDRRGAQMATWKAGWRKRMKGKE